MNRVKTYVILLVLILIVRLVAFFAASETAFLSVSKIKMRSLVAEKKKNAKIAAKLKKNIDELLSVILIGTNLMNTLASALATALAIELSGAGGVGIATALITFFVTTFGQIVPKTSASIRSEKIMLKSALPLFILEKVFYPVVWIFSLISKGTAKIAGKIWKTDESLVTEEELAELFEMGEKEGTLEKDESAMLNKIFKFNDLDVHDIMKHRSFVQSVYLGATKEDVIKKFNETGLKLIAVYEKNPENIVGVIHYKAVLLSQKDISEGVGYAAAVMNGVMFVPETFTAMELLSLFKKNRTEFAVALDEQGSLSGVVTMDDIMRVVFGRITEEKNENVSPESRIKLIGAGEFIVPGELLLDDINEFFKLGLESDYFMTLGGWLMEQFGYLPSSGEMFKYKNMLFIVEDQSQRRILSVRMRYVKEAVILN